MGESGIPNALGIRVPTTQEFLHSPVQAIGDLFSQRDSIGADKDTKNLLGDLFDRAQDQRRSDALKEALATKDLDQQTRDEINALFTARAAPEEITKILMAAKEGKGVYFSRRSNELQQKERSDRPGRTQTVLSLNNGSVLGGGRGY
jgi:hypothetical protein